MQIVNLIGLLGSKGVHRKFGYGKVKGKKTTINDSETSGQIARITKENAFMIKHGKRAK